MELQPKLHAAADMCEAGEEVNLDELSFLLRYAAEELAERPKAVIERDRLLERYRHRLEAHCDLLDRPEGDRQVAATGTLPELERLEATLEHELRTRYFPPGEPAQPSPNGQAERTFEQFVSGGCR